MPFADADLLTIALEFREAIVGPGPSARKCAMVCYPLAGYLDFLGLPVQTKETRVGRSNHLWLLLPDGRVLDPTADQFDATLPPVYLGAKLAMHGGKKRRASAVPAERPGAVPDPRQSVITVDIAAPASDETVQLVLDLKTETIKIHRRLSYA